MSTFGTADQGALPRRESPAGVAAARAFWTSMAVGAVALAAASVAIAQLFASWRIGGTPASHEVSLLGLRVSYPAANLAAIAVTVLAGFGLLIAGSAAWGLGRELLADRRFRRALAASSPVALHGVLLIADDTPQAFCAGLLRPRVYVSTGALELLDPAALAAVMAHERHHALRRDPLRVACGRALAAGLFFVPSLRHLVERQHALAEIGADEATVQTGGVDRSALASAMLSFADAAGPRGGGVEPERIDSLLGERASWRFPLALCVGAVAVLALFVAVAVLAARTAAGSATLAPPFLSSQPCVVMLALIPLAVAVAVAAQARSRRARRIGSLVRE
jgi:Zn-dependent protease with chaperone function